MNPNFRGAQNKNGICSWPDPFLPIVISGNREKGLDYVRLLESSVGKLPLQLVYNWCKTQKYYGALHGECHEGVDGWWFVVPKKSAAWISSLTGKDTMFFIRLRMVYTRFRSFDVSKWPMRRLRALASSTADVALPKDVITKKISSIKAVGWHCIALHIACPHCCVGNLVLLLAS